MKVRLTNFRWLAAGLVAVLGITLVRAQTPTPLPVFPITPGSSVEGNINNSFPSLRYGFDAQAGDSVTLRMDPTSGDLDPFLILFSPNGELLEQNDDEISGSRSALIQVTVTDAGTYTVEATRFQQNAGPSSGTYRLTLEIAGAATGGMTIDPLSIAPAFGVPFTYIDYQELRAGTLADEASRQYFVVGGQQGDLIRVTMTHTGGDVVPQVAILNTDLATISREAQAATTEAIVYATLPKTGWYLIEARSRAGSGSFDVYVDRRAVALIEVGQTVSEQFTADRRSISYIFNAHIDDQVIATAFATEQSSPISPEVVLLDLSLNTVASGQAGTQTTARARAVIPRSGTYIIQVTNQREDTNGPFQLRLSGIPVDIQKLSAEIASPASYNNLYKGVISTANAVDYYRFSGKTGELVTLQMNAANSILDPYLILTDSLLNELAFNDNVGNTANARIAQFALPQDDDYFILASRAGLSNGSSTGYYDLSITVGQISLLTGPLMATLTWQSEADLNLFVRDPDGRVVSWSRPQISSGGMLQIDSNTGCETPSAQPVEHIYWPPSTPPAVGEYALWVWYQNACVRADPVTFSLKLSIDGQPELDIAPDTFTLQPDQRFEAGFLVTASGSFVIDSGQITTPNAQRRASEGGDTLIRYGQSLNGTITDSVYALFYQFNAAANDQIIITAETLTGDLDPTIVLRDDADHNLTSNDDADSSTRSSRLTVTVPRDGLYIIAVTRYGLNDGSTTGDFRLTLQRATE